MKSSFNLLCPIKTSTNSFPSSVSLYFSFLFSFLSFLVLTFFLHHVTLTNCYLKEDMIYHAILMQGVFTMHEVLDYFKRKNTNTNVLIKHTMLMMWQHMALITLAAIRRVLREAYSFRVNCCRDLCREALRCVSYGGMCSGLTVTAHCPCPFSSLS